VFVLCAPLHKKGKISSAAQSSVQGASSHFIVDDSGNTMVLHQHVNLLG
jgi:hypothetical protein